MDKPTYCLDTSAFTSAYYDIYRASQFIGLWERMSGLVDEGRLRIPVAVFDELKYQHDDLFHWVNQRDHMVVEKDMDQLRVQLQIARDFPELARRHSSASPADPWVVALAAVNRFTVVSNEKTGTRENPKIPHICNRYGIRHWTVTQLVHQEGWQFR